MSGREDWRMPARPGLAAIDRGLVSVSGPGRAGREFGGQEREELERVVVGAAECSLVYTDSRWPSVSWRTS